MKIISSPYSYLVTNSVKNLLWIFFVFYKNITFILGLPSTKYTVRPTRNGLCVRQLAEVREKCFKYGYFSYKNATIHIMRPLFNPQSREAHFTRHGFALFDVFWTFQQKHQPCPTQPDFNFWVN